MADFRASMPCCEISRARKVWNTKGVLDFVVTGVLRIVVVAGVVAGVLSGTASAVTERAQETSPAEKPADKAKINSPSSGTSSNAAPRSTLGAAIDFAKQGNYDAAIGKYQQLLQEKPTSPDGYAGLTRCYLKKREVAQAYETAIKGLKVNDSWPIRVALGEVYFRQGKITEAEKEWVGAVNNGHPAARAYLGLAWVRRAIAMYKSEKAMIDKAHEMDATDPDIQGLWIASLPKRERVKYFESYLANPGNDDGEKRKFIELRLSSLKDEAKESRPCRLVSQVTKTETPLVRLLIDPTHLRGYGLAVELNGVKSNMMLDTGASGITVKRHIAERAGITRIAETQVWGVGDQRPKQSYVGTAHAIRVGKLEFQDCPLEVIEGRSVAGEEGLIGADVFEDFLVNIDFPNEMLRLSELPARPGEAKKPLGLENEEDNDSAAGGAAEDEDHGDGAQPAVAAKAATGPQDRYIAPEMQSYTPIFRFGHDLLVPTKIGDVPSKLFLMDTGAMTNSISPQAAREVTKVHGDSDMTIKGLSGSVKDVYSANKAVLQFGHLRQENQDLVAFDTTSMSESAGTEISGFFGFTMLRWLNIKIDYRDALVDFSFDEKRFGR